MKYKTLTKLTWIAVAILLSTSCEKDEPTNGDNFENLPNTSAWTFDDGIGYGGTYVAAQEITTGENYVEINVDVTKSGTYNLSTETVNGYKFSGQGELTAGEYNNVRLVASGTPINSGEDEFTVTYGESSYSFSIDVAPVAGDDLESKIVIRGTRQIQIEKGILTAYKASTGETVWNAMVDGFINQAAANNDTIFTNNSAYIEARNITTGDLIWSVTHESVSGYNGITYNNGNLYCSTDNGIVVAIKSSDGSLVQTFDLGTTSVVESTPFVVDDVVYVGHDSLWAFNTNGAVKWKYNLPGHSRSGITLDNGIVFASTNNGELCAVNASDGTLKWQYTVGTDGEECPTVSNGKVYSGNQNLYCLDASTGDLVWSKNDIVFEWFSPNVFNNTVYVAGNGNLHSLNAETGTSNWAKSSVYSFTSEIAACEEFIVYNKTGLVACYVENGEIMWSNADSQNFENLTLNPFIYDMTTKIAYLPSSYGNKK